VRPSSVVLNGVNNSRKSSGMIVVPCMYKGTTHNLVFQVLESDKVVNLIGRQDSARLGLVARINLVIADEC
jgi:hypothetical protein